MPRSRLLPGQKQDLVLLLGAVDDVDSSYVNGTLIGCTGTETPHHWESPRYYRISHDLLRTGQPNQLLIKVINGAYDGGLFGPVLLGLASALRPAEARGTALVACSTSTHGQNQCLRLTSRQQGLEYTVEYTLVEDRPLLSRQAMVRNVTSEVIHLTHFPCTLPPLVVGPGQAVAFPGTLPVGDRPLCQLAEGEVLRPRSLDSLAILWDAEQRLGVGT